MLEREVDAFDVAQVFEQLLGSIERCLAVAASAGVVVVDGGQFRLADAVFPFLQQPMRAALQGEIRSSLMQPLSFLDACSGDGNAPAGWRHTNPALLQAQGDASAAFPPMFKANVVSSLGDLPDQPATVLADPLGLGIDGLVTLSHLEHVRTGSHRVR